MAQIEVDSTRCQGHARCFAFAPDTFDFDDEGYAFVPADRREIATVSDDLRLAAANCPERAVLLQED